jgi:hypothetical protein
MAKAGWRAALVAAVLAGLLSAPAGAEAAGWLRGAGILVGGDLQNQDCRTGVCKHNENTDLIGWRGAIWLVHRTAGSQSSGPTPLCASTARRTRGAFG